MATPVLLHLVSCRKVPELQASTCPGHHDPGHTLCSWPRSLEKSREGGVAPHPWNGSHRLKVPDCPQWKGKNNTFRHFDWAGSPLLSYYF